MPRCSGGAAVSVDPCPFDFVFLPGNVRRMSTNETQSHHVLILHAVRDYPAWKKVFDDASAMRRDAGEQDYFVLRDERDPNRIVHFSKWASLDAAKSFFESPRLVEIRRQAGVEAPEFHYLRCLEQGRL